MSSLTAHNNDNDNPPTLFSCLKALLLNESFLNTLQQSFQNVTELQTVVQQKIHNFVKDSNVLSSLPSECLELVDGFSYTLSNDVQGYVDGILTLITNLNLNPQQKHLMTSGIEAVAGAASATVAKAANAAFVGTNDPAITSALANLQTFLQNDLPSVVTNWITTLQQSDDQLATHQQTIHHIQKEQLHLQQQQAIVNNQWSNLNKHMKQQDAQLDSLQHQMQQLVVDDNDVKVNKQFDVEFTQSQMETLACIQQAMEKHKEDINKTEQDKEAFEKQQLQHKLEYEQLIQEELLLKSAFKCSHDTIVELKQNLQQFLQEQQRLKQVHLLLKEKLYECELEMKQKEEVKIALAIELSVCHQCMRSSEQELSSITSFLVQFTTMLHSLQERVAGILIEIQEQQAIHDTAIDYEITSSDMLGISKITKTRSRHAERTAAQSRIHILKAELAHHEREIKYCQNREKFFHNHKNVLQKRIDAYTVEKQRIISKSKECDRHLQRLAQDKTNRQSEIAETNKDLHQQQYNYDLVADKLKLTMATTEEKQQKLDTLEMRMSAAKHKYDEQRYMQFDNTNLLAMKKKLEDSQKELYSTIDSYSSQNGTLLGKHVRAQLNALERDNLLHARDHLIQCRHYNSQHMVCIKEQQNIQRTSERIMSSDLLDQQAEITKLCCMKLLTTTGLIAAGYPANLQQFLNTQACVNILKHLPVSISAPADILAFVSSSLPGITTSFQTEKVSSNPTTNEIPKTNIKSSTYNTRFK
jgi:hypothetical protein